MKSYSSIWNRGPHSESVGWVKIGEVGKKKHQYTQPASASVATNSVSIGDV